MSTDLVGNMRNAVFTALSGCIPVPILQINGRTFKRVKLLGEGGFSMVYLVKDEATHRDFALKRIHCPLGTDAVRQAMNEAELYRLFNHPNIVKIMDSCVIQEKSGDKIVYLFLPYYKNGTLQDVINSAVETRTNLPERKMIRMFHGICLAVRELHTYELPNIPISSDEFTSSDNHIPYSHRDIKPGNVLIADDGTPILMDFGSLIRGPVTIRTRQQALLEQDRAAEHSTMSYRAPELFDVKTGSVLTEAVDIWSLGCLLYSMAYGQSPFEANMNEQGGNIALAVQNAKYNFPNEDNYSEDLRSLVKFMLVTNPEERPDIHQVIQKSEQLIGRLGTRD